MEVSGYLGSDTAAHAIFREIKAAALALGETDFRVSTSQIGLYRKHPFASVWKPAQYFEGTRPPLVLTVFLRRRDESGRWKEVVEPTPGHFTHHLELSQPSEVDQAVKRWLAEAWSAAG
jgi:hypothetical protein